MTAEGRPFRDGLRNGGHQCDGWQRTYEKSSIIEHGWRDDKKEDEHEPK